MDLKNIDFKNINFEDIKAKLLAIDKKTLIKIGIAAGSVIFFLIIYYAILNPIVNKKKIQLDDLNTKKEEIIKFNKEIKSIKSKKPADIKKELDKQGISVSGKSPSILKDIYLYSQLCGINIKRE